ncbi:hybrid sensor histidine kinase/response regulator [Massilia soli]|uniref:histidine kinase n=1 Tax=Massilia soli TaxID=2792854 RepID=A0ABS7SN79_9BURK|nr:ATP-binding protein [Massilia soli]MBZ2207379.1 response regulator [Massilia soli]
MSDTHHQCEAFASDARYRALVMASCAILWEASADGEFTAEQPGWTAYTGQRFDQLSGWGWLDAIHPDDRERTAALWREALAGRTMYQVEHRVRGRDGCYRYLNGRAMPIMNADGVLVEWIGAHADIDERKRAEERLRLLDAMSQATRNADDPISVMAVTTRMLGQYLDVTRCPYADVEPDNDRFTIRHDWTAEGASSTVGVYSLELFGKRATADMHDGKTFCITNVDRELGESDGAAMFNAIACKAIICCPLVKDGRLVAMMAVHQDRPRNWTDREVALVEETAERSWAHIERIRATEALRDADRRKTEFLAILAHELRNPLAPIRSGLQLLRETHDKPATAARVRDMMERQVNQMVDLVNDLLDVARINRGNFELKLARVALADVVAIAVETTMPLIESSGHTLNIDLPAHETLLNVDATRLAQVIGNVLGNAAKYTPAGGHIDIVARQEGQSVRISVTDNGIGIPDDAAHAIFDMFAQVGTSTERAQGGLGIGLSLARRLMELHGGTIELAPRPGAIGSTFDIRLPLADVVVKDTPPAAMDGAGVPRRAFRVLVVDDNEDAADMLATLMEMNGHTTRVANDGAQALLIAKEFFPEVAFLDIGMPGMDGYQLSEALGRMPQLAGLVRIALTGWGDENARARSRDAGFDHHLLKPCTLVAVEALLQEIAQRQRATA